MVSSRARSAHRAPALPADLPPGTVAGLVLAAGPGSRMGGPKALLHDAAGDPGGALHTVDHEIADVRRALTADPLDVRRLERLAELLDMARDRGSAAPIAVGNCRIGP